jgi:phage terminase Nu1 subunit (DNA packaging protein)
MHMDNTSPITTAPAAPTDDADLLEGWLNRSELAKELTLSVDTLQRWETRRMGPPCVRVGRKVLYRKEAVRDWLREQEARKTGQRSAAAGRR